MLSSCELLGPKQAAKYPLQPVVAEEGEESDILFKDLQNKPPASDADRLNSEFYPATGRSIKEPRARVSDKSKTGEKGSYSLNFDEADLGEVAKVILGDILKVNYILSPKVAGKVTLQTSDALTKEELLPVLEKVLKMNNAALVKQGDIYRIEPAADAVYSADVAPGKGYGQAGFQTKVIPVRYVSVTELADVIKPLVEEKTIVNVDPANNSLVVSGSTEEIRRVLDLVYTFDIDILQGRSFGLFPLAHVAPEDIIKELEVVFNAEDKEEGGEFFRFLPIERMNAILAITHQARYLSDIENWVFRLDRANTASGGGVNVYKCQHADAVELADTLNAIFTGAQKQPKAAKVAAGETAATITNKETATKEKASKSAGVQTGEAAVAGVSEVRIIPDEINNAIVVVSTPQEYEIIRNIIVQLDIMPLEVLIDATIVSVTLTDNLQYGIQWFLEHGGDGRGIITGGGSRTLATNEDGGVDLAAIAAAAATGGFGYSFVSNSEDVRVILRAEAQKNKVNVISSPSIMVLNNQEASIQVGDEIPLRTSQSTSVTNVNQSVLPGTDQTTGGLLTSGIQQRKTGVKLKVKPRVNANGFVIMDIEQTVERPVQTTTSMIDSPTIQTREITSNVAVHSGETLVLGGLIDEANTKNKGGIPFLNELPWIGALFGNTTKDITKTELVVLLTPRVVETKMDARMITDEFKRKLTGIYYDPEAPAQKKTVAEQMGL
ncbi:MAG: type II secretion system secretin GspD [Gammaproteobacteria bacterium]